MIEPTETETKERLDHFADAVRAILEEAAEDPEIARNAPYTTPVRRLDEAARAPSGPVVRQPHLSPVRIFSGIQPTGPQAPRQLPRRHHAVRGGPGPGRPGDLLHRGPARHERVLRPRGAARATCSTPRPRCMAAGLDPARCILFRQSDVKEHTELCWLLSSVTAYGDLQRMTQFKEKSAREQELVRTAPVPLPGAPGGRHPALPHRRGAGGRRPAPARRAGARDRPPLQRHLRRRAGGARAPDPGGRARGSWTSRTPPRRCPPPPAATPASCTSTTSRTPSGASSSARRPTPGSEVVRAPDKAGITNLIEILAVARGRRAGGRGARVRRAGLRRLQGGGGRGRGRAPGPGARALPGAARRRGRRSRPRSQEGADRARAIATGVMADVRAAMGVGPRV